MPRKKLTTAFLNTVPKARKGKRVEYTDTVQTGLSVRVTDKGKIYSRFRYRITGQGGTAENGRWLQGKKTYILHLGEYPAVGLAEAREKAGEYWKLARAGKNPADHKADEIKDRREKEANTFKRVAKHYLEVATKPNQKIGKKGPISETVKKQRETDLNDVIYPILGDKPIAGIDEPAIKAFLDELEHDPRSIKYPSRVDRMLDAIRAVFHFAKKKGYVPENPTREIEDRYAHTERDRWLKDSELKAMWKATEGLGNFGKIVRVLALTGQRSGEVKSMTWRDLDLENAIWNLPPQKNKSRRVHFIPLSKTVLRIIEGQPRGKPGDYVFHGQGGGDKKTSTTPKQTIPLNKKMLEILQEVAPEAELEHWTPHDLRRTLSTNAAKLGVTPHIAELILNHESKILGKMGRIYNQHAYEPEIRKALEDWDLKLRQIVSGIEEVKETA
ncbi:MAG: tyrosine-type recombinase/integrase [Rhodospirillales bacterium]|nr:tyrosine-type recombinase/integrase [Rhodospirillales bacterium]